MEKKIFIGAAYYPELWDEREIEKDILRCKELGVNTLRIGEFAWSKIELTGSLIICSMKRLLR